MNPHGEEDLMAVLACAVALLLAGWALTIVLLVVG